MTPAIKPRGAPVFVDAANAGMKNAVARSRPATDRKIAFGWYGGKFSHLGWLLPLLPECHHYCEPFAGSFAVILNRKPSPVETANDMDGDVVHFFRTLRERENELIRAVSLTPFSREEFHLAVCGSPVGLSDIERARRFFVRARQSRSGMAQAATLGKWAACRNDSASGMSAAVSRWTNGMDGLGDVAGRLLRVQIEDRPAVDCIRACDSERTLFYVDPPYVHSTRGDPSMYRFEMDDKQHVELAETLGAIKGKAAVSGYRCPLMDRLYAGWDRFDTAPKRCPAGSGERVESLWANYGLQPLLDAAGIKR